MKCRHCSKKLTLSLIDFGSAPPSNAYLTNKTLHMPEKWFPLRVLVCEGCWLVQTEDFAQEKHRQADGLEAKLRDHGAVHWRPLSACGL